MANKKLKMSMELDFTSNKSSLENIKKQLETAIKTVELNVEVNPKDKKKVIDYIKEIDRLAEKSYNKSTQKINKKMMDGFMTGSDILPDMATATKEMSQFGVIANKSFTDINNSNKLFNEGLKSSDTMLTRMGTTLANTIRWNISSSLVNSFTGSIKEAYYFAKDLERELTNIRIVSGESAENMKIFSQEANKSAKALKVSTLDYAEAATLFYQQGLRGDDVTNMTDAAVMASNITGQAAVDMSDLLTSTMNGYSMITDEVLSITDKLSAVGATTASDFNELATGMSKVASMANAAGVDIDQLNGQLSTIISTTRESPESIGMSLKTIYGRMLAFKNNTSKMMEDEDGEMFGVPSVEAALAKFSAATGDNLSLFKIASDGKKELKDLGTVIEQIGDSWSKTEDKTAKFGLTTALAGSRQQNRLIALFDSWEKYEEAVKTSLEAEGTTLKQNEIYMESYEGRLKGLQAAKEELFMTITEDSGGMKNFISGMTKAVELSSSLLDTVGGISAILGLVGSTLATIALPKGFEALDKIKEDKVSARTTIGGTADTGGEINKADLEKVQKLRGDQEAEILRRNLDLYTQQHQALRTKEDLLKSQKGALDRVLEVSQNISKEEISTDSVTKIQAITKATEERAQAMKKVLNSSEPEEKDFIQEQIDMITIRDQKLLESAEAEAQAHTLRMTHRSAEASALEEVSLELQSEAAEIDQALSDMSSDFKTNISETVDSLEIVDEKLENVTNTVKDYSAEWDKQQKIMAGVNTFMRVGIPMMSAARDESKSLGDVAATGATTLLTMLPLVLSNLGKITAAYTKAAAAATGATGAATGFAGVIAGIGGVLTGTIVGPILAAVMGVTAISGALFLATNDARKFKKAMEEAAEATQEREEVESKKDQLDYEKTTIEARIQALDEIGKNRTSKDNEELEILQKQSAELERQLELENYLLEVAKEKESQATLELMRKESKSDYIKTEKDQNYGGYSYKVTESANLTAPAEVEAIVKELEEYDKIIKDIEQSISDTLADDGLNEKEKTKKVKELNEKLKESESTHKDLSAALIEKNTALKESVEKIGEVEGANKDLKDQIEEIVEASDNYIDNIFGIGEASEKTKEDIEGLNDGLSEQEVLLMELQERYDELSPKIFDLYETIQDPETPEYDRIKALEEMADVYGELIEMDLPTEFFRTAENMALLSEAINGSDEAWWNLQLNALKSIEHIENVALAMDWSQKQITDMTNHLDLLEFTVDGDMDATKFLQKMIEMGHTIEEAQQMLNELAGTEVKFDMTYQPVDFPVGDIQGEQMAFRKHRENVPKNLKGAIIKGGLGKSFNPFSMPNQSYTARRPDRNKDGSKKPKPEKPKKAKAPKKGKSGSKGKEPKEEKKGKSGSKGKEPKEEKKAEADAYAELNQALEKNNALIEHNNQMQKVAGIDFDKRISLIKQEGKLYEERGKHLKTYSNQLIAEAKFLQPQLEAIGIGFQGSWGDGSIALTNLDKIDGKSTILGDKLKRVQDIIKEMPSVTKDWWENWQKQHEIVIKQLDTIQEKYDRQRKNLEWENSKLENNIKKMEQSIEIGSKSSKEHLTSIQDITNEYRKQQSIHKKNLEFQRLELQEVRKLITEATGGKAKFAGSGDNLRITNQSQIDSMNLPGLDNLTNRFKEITINEIPKLYQAISDSQIAIIDNNNKILDSIEAQVEALEELNSVRFDNYIDNMLMNLEKLNRQDDLLLFKFDMYGEEDYEDRVAILGDLFESNKDKISDYRRQFERLSQITPRNADEASSLASAMEEVQNGMREAFTATRDYQRQLEQMQFDAISTEFRKAGEQMETFRSIIDLNMQSLQQGLLPDFSLDMVLPIPDFSGVFDEVKSENEKIYDELRDHEDQVQALKRQSLDMQLKDAEAFYLKEKAEIGNHYQNLETQISEQEDKLSTLRGGFSEKEAKQLTSFIAGTRKMIETADKQALKDEELYQKDTLNLQVKEHSKQFNQASSHQDKVSTAQIKKQWARVEAEAKHQREKQTAQETGQTNQLRSAKTHGTTMNSSQKTTHEKLADNIVDNWLDPQFNNVRTHYIDLIRLINGFMSDIFKGLKTDYERLNKMLEKSLEAANKTVNSTLSKINAAIQAARTLNDVSSGASAPGSGGSYKKAFGGAFNKSSSYGIRVHPITGKKTMHTGVDLAAASGTAIPSQMTGTVTKAGWGGGYGNVVFVTNGNQQTVYAHMSSIGVKQGQQVKVGQVLGRVGSTGNSTGPHLHYEKRINGRHVHPGYARGTSFHPGGTALIGEEGYELGLLPGGKTVILGAQGSEIVDLPPGTEVLTHEETKKILKHTGNIDGKEIPKYAKGTPGAEKNPIISGTGKVNKDTYALTPWRERIEVIIQGDKAFTIDGGYVPEGYHLIKDGTDYKYIGKRGKITEPQEMYEHYRKEQSNAVSQEAREYYSNKAKHTRWMQNRLSDTTRRDGLNFPILSEGLFEKHLDANTQLDLQRTGKLPEIPNFTRGPSKEVREGAGKYAGEQYSSVGFTGYDNYEKDRVLRIQEINVQQLKYLEGLGTEEEKKKILSLIDEQILADMRAQSILSIDMAEQEKKNIELFLESTKLRIDATEDLELKGLLTQQYNEAVVQRQQAEQTINDTIERRYQMEFSLIDKKIAKENHYQNIYSKQLTIAKELYQHNYDGFELLNNQILRAEKNKLSTLKQSSAELKAQQRLLPIASKEWNVIQERIENINESILDSTLAIIQQEKAISQDRYNKIIRSEEKKVFGGERESDVRDDLDKRIKEQNRFVSGLEKELLVEKMIIDARSNEIELTQSELDLLNSRGKIEREQLDRLEKRLRVRAAEQKLENLQGQRTKQEIYKKDDGTYDFRYTVDQEQIDNAEREVKEAKLDLIKWEQDLENNKERERIDEKSKYLNKLRELTNNALQGEYADMSEFYSDANIITSEFRDVVGTNVGGTVSALAGEFDNFLIKVESIRTALSVDETQENSILDIIESGNIIEKAEDIVNQLTEIQDKALQGHYESFDAFIGDISLLGENLNLVYKEMWLNIVHEQFATNLKLKTSLDDMKAFYQVYAVDMSEVSKELANNIVISSEIVENAIRLMTTMVQGMSKAARAAANSAVESMEVAHESMSGAIDYAERASSAASSAARAAASAAASAAAAANAMSASKTPSPTGFETGGYTGSFSGGKLAILHEKELVLNKSQTAAFIELTKDLPGLLNTLDNAKNVVTGRGQMNLKAMKEKSSSNEQVFNIAKIEFPNVKDAQDIENAILNLPARVKQYTR